MFFSLKNNINSLMLPLIVYGYGIGTLITLLFTNFDNNLFAHLSRLIILIFTLYVLVTCIKFRIYSSNLIIYSYIIFWIIYIYKIIISYNIFILSSIYDSKVLFYAVFITFLPSICLYQNYTFEKVDIIKKLILVFGLIFILTLVLYLLYNYDISTLFRQRVQILQLNSTTICQLASIFLLVSYFNISRLNTKNKFWFLLFISICLFIIVISLSRAVVFSLYLCIFIYIILNRKKITFLLFALYIYFYVFLFLFLHITDRVSAITAAGSITDASATIRKDFSSQATEIFLNQPVIGEFIFIDMDKHLHPHNILLEVFMSTGIIGGLLLSLILLISVSNAIRLLMIPRYEWVGACLLHSFFISLFHHAIWMNSILFSMLIFGHCCLQTKKES